MNRRKFLVSSLESAAGFGILAGCDKRTVVGLDVRAPSAPTGLAYGLLAAPVRVTLTWDRHNLTDITGARSESGIKGYNVYRSDGTNRSKLTQVLVPFDSPSYEDAGVAPGTVYVYAVTAIDASGNEGPQSDPQEVVVQTPVAIYTVSNISVVNTGTIAKPNIQAGVVKNMIDSAVWQMQIDNGAIAGTAPSPASIASAWESLFPGLGAASLIGIKINTLGGGNVSTKPQVVQAIVNSLKSMLGGTFFEHNIIVFDDRVMGQMQDAGFDLIDDGVHYRIACTQSNTMLPQKPNTTGPSDPANLWADGPISVNGVSQKVSRIVEAVDFIINVPVLKDHSWAGITFSMKNLYGLVDLPGNLHSSMCSPFIPALYNTVFNNVKIRDKIRLIVGDAIIGCMSNGPTGSPNIYPYTIVVGTDPVAVDTWAMHTINSYRKSPLAQISFSPSPNPMMQSDARHILAAALPPYSLGSTNYAAKEVALT